MTLVSKMIYVPGVQFYNTLPVYFIVCSPPKVKSPSITIYHPFTLFYLPPPPYPLGCLCLWSICCLCLCSIFVCLLNPFTFFTQSLNSLPSDSCRPVLCIYESVSILFVSLFCSLDSTHKCNHMVLAFLWLAYLNF